MANVSFLHPPPVTVQHTDKNGNVTPAWQKWYQQAYLRLGGQTAISNISLTTNSGQLAGTYIPISNSTAIYASPTGLTTVIDSFSVTNQDRVSHTLNVWLVPANQLPSTANIEVTNLSILPNTTVSIASLVSQAIGSNGALYATVDVANVVTFALNGRQAS